MRPQNIGSAQYAPGNPPTDPAELQRYLQVEFNKIAAAIALLVAGHIDKINVAPPKPRDGDIRYADGTNWNPGGGKGLYMSNGTVWTLIKAIP